MKVFEIPKNFAIFAKGKFAPSESEEVFKKSFGGVQGQGPCIVSQKL